ncbi:MAG: hypothetical protein E7174_01745 [Firmicutes bacterium]|nr:hypothetical protein [Bacillota bacterium]
MKKIIYLSFLFFYSTNVVTNLLYISNGDNMRKKFKTKKKFKFRIILFPLISTIVIMLLTHIFKTNILPISNEIIIGSIFKNNNYVYNGVENNHITQQFYNYIKKNIFNSPLNLLQNELKINEEEKETVNIVYEETIVPRVYIYNSHQGESYSQEYLEEYNIIPDVLMASNILKDKLEDIGINSIVEESDILAYLKENNLNHAGSYEASRFFLSKIINSYPDIELFIDLHRDAATHSVSTTTINNKPCAKVLFVIGLENENYEKNLSIVTKINNIILEKYPTLTRGIMKKQGYGVNGVYNQDLADNVILIEIGGNENNIEEVNNTLDIVALVIGEYLNEKE